MRKAETSGVARAVDEKFGPAGSDIPKAEKGPTHARCLQMSPECKGCTDADERSFSRPHNVTLQALRTPCNPATLQNLTSTFHVITNNNLGIVNNTAQYLLVSPRPLPLTLACSLYIKSFSRLTNPSALSSTPPPHRRGMRPCMRHRTSLSICCNQTGPGKHVEGAVTVHMSRLSVLSMLTSCPPWGRSDAKHAHTSRSRLLTRRHDLLLFPRAQDLLGVQVTSRS